MEENLFAGIEAEKIQLPLEILNSFADQFNKTFTDRMSFQVSKKLEDEVDDWTKIDIFERSREQSEKRLVARATIVVSGLNDYRLLVLKLSYLRSIVYPCEIVDVLNNKETKTCNTPEEVNDTLATIFKTESFQRPLRMILSQLEHNN